MPINITSITIANEMHTGTSTSLIGNAFNKMTATIRVNALKLVNATSSNGVVFAPDGYGSLDYIKMENSGNAFSEFVVGDSIVVTGTAANNGTYTIIEKLNNYTIRVSSTLTNVTDNDCFIECQTDFTSLDFYYGLIENSEAINFLSKIDGQPMRYKKDVVTTSHVSMAAVGLWSSWRLGNVTVKEISPATSAYGQDFEFVHTFYIHPFFLYTNDLTTPSTWFDVTKCLRYVFAIRTQTSSAVLDGSLYKEFAIGSGNTGWINENLNTGVTNYSVSGVTFTKVSDSSSVDAVMLVTGDKTRVNFAINNATDTPFSNGNTKVKVHIINIPYDPDEFQETTTELDDNFTFDTCLNTLGSASVDGDFARCIDDFTCTYVSTSQITCQFDVNLALADYTRISGYADQKYLIAVTVQNHTKTIVNTDTVTLAVSYDDYDLQAGTDDVVTADSWLTYEHPFFENIGQDAPDECFVEDERRSICTVKIDTSTSLYAPSLRSIECGVRLYNTSTGETVSLDGQYLDVSGNPLVNGLQFVDMEIPRSHQAMTTEDFKRILIRREVGLDATDVWYYTVDFPFLVRWEDWIANPAIPTDFFDSSLEENGLNNDWSYFTVGDWQVQLYVDTTIRFNGVDTVYNLNKQIIPYTYVSSPADWINPDIISYDTSDNDLLDNILGYEDTKIVCQFEYAGTSAPTVDEVEFVLRLEPYQNGGRTISTRFSSVFELTSATQWESTGVTNKIVKSINGNIYYAEALIENSLLQNFNSFSITARIYDLRSVDNAKLLEDGEFKLQEDGDYKLLE